MQLEEVIERAQEVKQYEKLAEEGFNFWDEELTDRSDSESCPIRSLRTELHDALICHNGFYDSIDGLEELAKATFPEPENYGENAVNWFQTKKRGDYSKLAVALGVTSGIISIILKIPWAPSSFFAASVMAGLALAYFQRKAQALEEKGDTRKYLNISSGYSEAYSLLRNPDLEAFERFVEDYSTHLKNLIDRLKPYSVSKEHNLNRDHLVNNYIGLWSFKRYFKEMIKTLQEDKKPPCVN